ncbi:MAG: hypothetical protein A3G92_07525 [Deltaproteobacteria bacterium RIFCSPLOWO2_12_FULL_38_8]|nr:MAG: hypothetical protein A3G92_07525 [Deltaproteobacteria bacterium RIFCSPLOWO2_12_FULL_38_8]
MTNVRPRLIHKSFRWFCLQPYFKGKSRVENILSKIIPLSHSNVIADFPDGFHMTLNFNSPYEKWLYYHNCELDTYTFIKKFLKPGMVFMDCGANMGFYSLVAASSVTSSGHVYSFEPTPSTFARLQKNLNESKFKNIQAFACALGETKGEAHIFQLDSFNHGMNTLAPMHKEAIDTATCHVFSLDGMLSEQKIQKPNLIKLDVEGSELAVLRGATKLLKDPSAPTMIIELSPITTSRFGYKPEDIIDFILSVRNFSVEWIHHGKRHPVTLKKKLPHYSVLGAMHGSNYTFYPR